MMRLAVFILLGLPVLLGSGCGREQGAFLAKVGEEEIHLDQFQREFDEVSRRGRDFGRDADSVRRYLDRVIEETLFAQVAADSVQWSPVLEHRARGFLEGKMMRRLQEDAYRNALDIPDDEVRQVYQKAGTRYHYRQMYFRRPSEAVPVRAMLNEGARFTAVASHYGFENGGDRGWHTILDVPQAIIELLEGLQPGEVGGPLNTGGTTYLVQLVEKGPDPEPTPPLEQVMETLRQGIRQQKAGSLIFEFGEELLLKYKYEERPLEISWMTRLLHERTRGLNRQAPRESGPSQDESPWETCPIDEPDWGRVLAVSTVDTVKAILILDHLMTKLLMTWPTFEEDRDVAWLCREIMLDRVERAECWAREYDKDPELAWQDRRERRLMLVRNFRVLLRQRVDPTLEEAQAWYAAHAADFAEPEKRRFSLLHVRDWDTALRARKILTETRAPAEAMAAIRRLDSTAGWVESGQGEISSANAGGPIDRQLVRMDPGMVTEPVPFQDRFAIARLEEIIPSRVAAFEIIAEQVYEEMTKAKTDSLYDRHIEMRRAAAPVRINEELLRQVRFDASTGQVQG